MTIREKMQALKAELASLDEVAAREEERAADYLRALREERASREAQLRAALAQADRREVIYNPYSPNGPWAEEGKSGHELAAELRHALEGIDYELRRLGAES